MTLSSIKYFLYLLLRHHTLMIFITVYWLLPLSLFEWFLLLKEGSVFDCLLYLYSLPWWSHYDLIYKSLCGHIQMYISSLDSFSELRICMPKAYLTLLFWCLIDIWISTFPKISSQSSPHLQSSQLMATSSLYFLRPKLEVILDFPLSYIAFSVQQEILLALASEDVWNLITLYHLYTAITMAQATITSV